jgi:uncharacterized protein (TIGR02246 family)
VAFMMQMTRPEDAPIHFQAAWNAHDMEALGALFHPDARFVNRFGRYVEGVEAIVAMHAPIHATVYSDSVMANELIDVLPIGDTAAVVHFWSRLTMGEAHPAGPHTVDTVILAVLTVGEGRWKFHAFENVTLVDPRTGQAVLRSEGQAEANRKAGR